MDIYRYTEHLSLFVDIARRGTFSAVARGRGANPSSIMRKIDMLERVMGAALFTRSTRGLLLTEAGEALFARAVAILDALSDMHSEIRSLSGECKGTLRVSCLPTFARHHILPWLSRFRQDYPNMDIMLDLTERLTNPSLERLDAALRIGELKNSALYASRVGEQRWLACAGPGYLARNGTPAGVDALSGHQLLDKYQDPRALCWRRIIPSDLLYASRISLRCNDFDTLRQAAIADMGIAFLPDWVTDVDLQAGRLVRVFDDPQRQVAPIHLLRALPGMSAKLRVFVQSLRGHLQEALNAGARQGALDSTPL